MIGEIYDVKSKSMIWVGRMTGRSNPKGAGQAERVDAAVTRLLKGYLPVGWMPVDDAMEK